MAEIKYVYKRLSIGTNSGSKVLAVSQSAETLSAALTQEIDYFVRAKRTPAEIQISKED